MRMESFDNILYITFEYNRKNDIIQQIYLNTDTMINYMAGSVLNLDAFVDDRIDVLRKAESLEMADNHPSSFIKWLFLYKQIYLILI